MSCEHTKFHLVLFCVVMKPALVVMRDIFEGEREMSAMEFGHSATSPSVKAILRYFDVAQDQNDDFWLPWQTLSQWGTEAVLLAFKTLMCVVGNLYMRLCLPFRNYPWRLVRTVHPFSSEEEKDAEWRFLEGRCDKCLDSGFSAKILKWFRNGWPKAKLQRLLYHAFKACAMNNVPIEVMFARARNYTQCNRGRVSNHSTTASKHVLAEIKRLMSRKTGGWPARQKQRPRQKKVSLRKYSGWNMFTRHHRGKAPSEVSKLWHSVSEEEKKKWVEGSENKDHSPMGAIRDNADEDLVCVQCIPFCRGQLC